MMRVAVVRFPGSNCEPEACRAVERAGGEAYYVRHRETSIPLLEERFASRTAAEWLEALAAASVPCAPVRTLDEVFASREGAGAVQEVIDDGRGPLRLVADPIRVDGRRLPARRPPPTLGEHTREVLGELEP